jgi:ISXO2-like transposase domain
MHKIRNAMVNDEIKLLAGILEMDETYVGGKPRKSNDIVNPKPNSPRGRGTSKECVIGIIERNGNVKVTHVRDEPITSEYLQKIVKTNVDINNSTLITDQYPGYSKMSALLKHKQINHKKAFSNLNGIHTNTIEGF